MRKTTTTYTNDDNKVVMQIVKDEDDYVYIDCYPDRHIGNDMIEDAVNTIMVANDSSHPFDETQITTIIRIAIENETTLESGEYNFSIACLVSYD